MNRSIMKVLHVISSIDLKYGGSPRFVLDLVTKQNKMFQDSSICTTSEPQDNGKRLQKNSFLKKKIISFKTNIFHTIRYSQGFKNFIDHHIEQYDIIHIHGLYRFPTTYAAYKARKLKIPYIITPHGSLDPYLYRRSAKSLILKRLWEFFFDVPNIRNASAIHCISNL